MDDTIYYILFNYSNGTDILEKYLFFNYETTRDQIVNKINTLLTLDESARYNIQNHYLTPDGKLIYLRNIQEIIKIGLIIFSDLDSISNYTQ